MLATIFIRALKFTLALAGVALLVAVLHAIERFVGGV